MKGKPCTSTSRRSASTRPSPPRSSSRSSGGEDAPGVREGGVLSQITREVNVSALPLEILGAHRRGRLGDGDRRHAPARGAAADRGRDVPRRSGRDGDRDDHRSDPRGRARGARRRPRAEGDAEGEEPEGAPTRLPAARPPASPARPRLARALPAPGRLRLVARPARRRPGESRAAVRGSPAQRRVHGRRGARAPRRGVVSLEVQRAARRGASRRCAGRAAQARDVHERVGPGRWARPPASTRSTRRPCSSSTTRATSTSAACRCAPAAASPATTASARSRPI